MTRASITQGLMQNASDRLGFKSLRSNSSGNTAAALAMFSAMRGYQCKLITNRKTSQEKIQQLGAYGAEVIITASGVPVVMMKLEKVVGPPT